MHSRLPLQFSMGRPKPSRRRFLRATAKGTLLAGGLCQLPVSSFGTALGASTKIRIGLIGVGGKGQHAIGICNALRHRIEIVALCDVYGGSLQKALALAPVNRSRVRQYHDFRHLLEQKDVDAVVISTPDHWHALTMIHACMAGKDVYLEKPVSHRLEEGRRMVQVARHYGRVIQVGTQQRCGNKKDSLFFRAVDIIRGGVIGDVTLVKCFTDNNLWPGLGNPPDEEPPRDLDWDRWLGPAPKRTFNPGRFLHSFRWFWDYSGGKATDWGTHWLDVAQWAMDGQPVGSTDTDHVGTLPISVSAHGRKFILPDHRETPDTLQATVEYPNFLLTYENRVCNDRKRRDGETHGMEFYGRLGSLFVNRSRLVVTPDGGKAVDGERLPEKSSRGESYRSFIEHMANFLDCMESRAKPASDIEIAHRSTSTAHLINIALQRQERIHWDARNERITNSESANELLKAHYRAPWKLPNIV